MSIEADANSINRRGFLAGAAAATFTVMKPSLVRGTQANGKLSVGLIGCGGRGSWLANLFEKSDKYKLTACADYFQDKVDAVGDKMKVEPARRFTTLSGYKKLLETDIDVALIETPPYFHPSQAMDSVDAGKHVFLAKPIAVDAPGCLKVLEAGKKATEKKQNFLIDFQTRADETFREMMKRVQSGAIGKLSSAQGSYLWDMGVHDQPINSPEDRLRLWYNSKALCGDVIVEQDIHTIDVATWFAGADPILAFGNGGRLARKHGEIWDHFAVTFVFPDNFVVNFLSQKSVPKAPDEIRLRVFGTEGWAEGNYGGQVKIEGNNPFPGAVMTDLYARGASVNISEFYDQITAGDVSNPTVVPSVRSNITCVLGRNAAYKGKVLTLKELIEEGEVLTPDFSGLKA